MGLRKTRSQKDFFFLPINNQTPQTEKIHSIHFQFGDSDENGEEQDSSEVPRKYKILKIAPKVMEFEKQLKYIKCVFLCRMNPKHMIKPQ